MHQNITTPETTYRQFAQSIVTNDMVWGLTSSKGFINLASREFEDSQVIPFWSSETLAEAAAKEGGQGFKPTAVPLSEFLENWLVGMYTEGYLAGINWQAKNFGAEVEPLELAIEIASQLIANGKELTLTKYKDIADYQLQVRQTLEAA